MYCVLTNEKVLQVRKYRHRGVISILHQCIILKTLIDLDRKQLVLDRWLQTSFCCRNNWTIVSQNRQNHQKHSAGQSILLYDISVVHLYHEHIYLWHRQGTSISLHTESLTQCHQIILLLIIYIYIWHRQGTSISMHTESLTQCHQIILLLIIYINLTSVGYQHICTYTITNSMALNHPAL